MHKLECRLGTKDFRAVTAGAKWKLLNGRKEGSGAISVAIINLTYGSKLGFVTEIRSYIIS
jgi:hypothetical protein